MLVPGTQLLHLSTIVHSTPIPAKEQPLVASSGRPVSDESSKNPWEMRRSPGNVRSSSQAPQGAQAVGPGRVACSVLPHESGSTNHPYGTSRSAMNSGYPPQQQIPQAYGYHQMPSQAMGGYTLHSQAFPCANTKVTPDVALDMRAPQFQLSAGSKSDPFDRLAAETNLYTRSLNGIVAAAASAGTGTHRKVGVVPSGMSRMY